MWLYSSLAPIRPREWLVAAILLLLVPTVYRDVRDLFPPVAPVVAHPGTVRAGMTPDGLWRVERTITINELCGTTLWSRTFKGTVNGEPVIDLLLPAEASSLAYSTQPVSRGGRRGPGTYTDWWTYQIPAGFRGVYMVQVALADCPSGFNDLVQVYVVDVP